MNLPVTEWQAIAAASDLTPGQFLEFRLTQTTGEPAGAPLTGFAFLDGDTPRAYLNACPHLGIELNWLPGRFMDVDNLFIQCSTHGALFKPGSGECIAGPCQGDALTPLEIRLQNGEVQVRAQD
ncbi:Rieske (2Fe-2S) protein [Marinobacter daepoensis]|uniref:Rieske (2Fe-2S) protein n=1 Tax=Marinobacter daepoensis TaxID=262077 RepID=UPI000409F4F6|nr:Rieske 2Fe-2S domain-containing protein [Marinobacter daepoensis]